MTIYNTAAMEHTLNNKHLLMIARQKASKNLKLTFHFQKRVEERIGKPVEKLKMDLVQGILAGKVWYNHGLAVYRIKGDLAYYIMDTIFNIVTTYRIDEKRPSGSDTYFVFMLYKQRKELLERMGFLTHLLD